MEKISQSTSNKIANMGIVCSLLVVAIHCGSSFVRGTGAWWSHECMGGSLGKIAVPYFFCVAGFLLMGGTGEPLWWKNAMAKRIRSLIVPFFFWNVVMLSVSLSMCLLANLMGGHDVFRNMSIPYVLGEMGLLPDRLPIDAPLWFVRTLFFLVILSPVLRLLSQRRFMVVSLCGLLALVTIFCDVRQGANPLVDRKFFIFQYDDLKAMVYFTVGMHLRMYEIRFSSIIRRVICIAAVGTWCGTLVMDFLGVCGAFKFSQLFIPLGMLAMWWMMPKGRWSSNITSLAFPLYCIHFPIMRIYGLIPVVSYLQLHRGDGAVILVLYFVVVVFVSICAVSLMKRIPRLSVIAFGGRAERK